MSPHAIFHRHARRRIAGLLCLVMVFASLLGGISHRAAAASAAAPAGELAGEPAGELAGLSAETQTPVTVRVYASDDVFVRGGSNANTKFGAATPAALQVKNYSGTNAVDKREAFIKFDLSGVPGVITGASVHLYGAVTDGAQPGGKPVSLEVYGVANDAWTGTEITWNAGPVKGNAVAGPIAMLNNKPADWYSADVTAYVVSEQAADQTASIALVDSSLANCFVSFHSMEASNQPYLAVTYTPADAADTEPPVWPEGTQLSGVLAGPASASLDWSPAQDASGIFSYRIYANDMLLGGVPGTVTSYEAVSLIPGEVYEFRVEAADPALRWSTNGPTVKVAVPVTEQKLYPTDDTYVNAGAKADMNYGSDASLLVKKNAEDLTRESLLKFDLGSAIEDIGSALLYVYAVTNDGGGTTVTNELYSASEQWSEASATWNTKPEARDFLQSFTADRTPKWFALDATAYVKGQAAAGKHASFLISQSVTNGLNVIINSKENDANKPYLQISKSRLNPDAPVWDSSRRIDFV